MRCTRDTRVVVAYGLFEVPLQRLVIHPNRAPSDMSRCLGGAQLSRTYYCKREVSIGRAACPSDRHSLHSAVYSKNHDQLPRRAGKIGTGARIRQVRETRHASRIHTTKRIDGQLVPADRVIEGEEPNGGQSQ